MFESFNSVRNSEYL